MALPSMKNTRGQEEARAALAAESLADSITLSRKQSLGTPKSMTQFNGASASIMDRYIRGRKRHNRRCANEIQKQYQCPFDQCGKYYGSEGSLNLHLRIKHQAGSKTEREKTAKQIVMALQSGQQVPFERLEKINLPPGTLEKVATELGINQQPQPRIRPTVTRPIMTNKPDMR